MTPRALTLALIGSVALNLFVIGAVVGGAVVAQRRPEAPAAPPAVGPSRPLGRAAEALSPPHRQAYGELLWRQAGPVGAQLERARGLRRQAWTEFGAGRLNEQELSRRLAEARAVDMAARGEVEDKIAQFAATLPADERAELTQALANRGLRGGMGGRRDHDRP